jgi:hypothetical protein
MVPEVLESDEFVIAWHDGFWRIHYGGQWYGAHASIVSAAVVAVRIARRIPKTSVSVRKDNGLEMAIWP